MTSAVTSIPRCLAQRTMSTLPAVDRWHTCRREPTCWASSTSRAMIDSSATAGQPARPSSAETTPSCIWAPSVSRGSWACWAMTPSKDFTYSRARRISTRVVDALAVVAEHTDLGAGVAPSRRARRGAPPRVPRSRRRSGRTVHRRRLSPRRATCSTTPAVSATGEVLAMAWTAVKPPRAAARVPVTRSSRPPRRRARADGCAGPRDRAARCSRRPRSISASSGTLEVRADAGDAAVLEEDVLDILAVGATTADQQRGRLGATGGCVLVRWSSGALPGVGGEQVVEHGHAHEHTGGDLLDDDAARGVRDGPGDLETRGSWGRGASRSHRSGRAAARAVVSP